MSFNIRNLGIFRPSTNYIGSAEKHFGSCRQIGEAGVVLVYYDPFELTTFQQEYGDDPVSHQGFAE